VVVVVVVVVVGRGNWGHPRASRTRHSSSCRFPRSPASRCSAQRPSWSCTSCPRSSWDNTW